MNLYEKVNNDMLNAMKSKDKELLSTIRLLKSAIDLYKINNKLDSITDEIVIEVAAKQVKTHKESIIEFERAEREDLIEKLKKEILVLEKYLPEQLSQEEITKIIEEVIKEVNASSKKEMGLVMKELNQKLKGKADFKLVSEIVNQKLN